MRVPWHTSFEVQRRQYRFCFTCEDCAHHHPEAASCVHGFPNAEHLQRHYTPEDPPSDILFCKEFELA